MVEKICLKLGRPKSVRDLRLVRGLMEGQEGGERERRGVSVPFSAERVAVRRGKRRAD